PTRPHLVANGSGRPLSSVVDPLRLRNRCLQIRLGDGRRKSNLRRYGQDRDEGLKLANQGSCSCDACVASFYSNKIGDAGVAATTISLQSDSEALSLHSAPRPARAFHVDALRRRRGAADRGEYHPRKTLAR